MRQLCVVCGELQEIVCGLERGSVEFVYDNFVQEGSLYHPADILEDILCDVADVLYENPDAYISDSRLEIMLKKLKAFRRCFRISELLEPIGQLESCLTAAKLPLAA